MNTKQDFAVSAGSEKRCYEFDNAASIIRIQYLPIDNCFFKNVDFYIGLEDLDALITLLSDAKNDIDKERARNSKEDCK